MRRVLGENHKDYLDACKRLDGYLVQRQVVRTSSRRIQRAWSVKQEHRQALLAAGARATHRCANGLPPPPAAAAAAAASSASPPPPRQAQQGQHAPAPAAAAAPWHGAWGPPPPPEQSAAAQGMMMQLLGQMASRIGDLERQVDGSREREHGMLSSHHEQLLALRQRENDRLTAELATERAGRAQWQAQLLQLTRANAELLHDNTALRAQLGGGAAAASASAPPPGGGQGGGGQGGGGQDSPPPA
jgi:hypothetical protein